MSMTWVERGRSWLGGLLGRARTAAPAPSGAGRLPLGTGFSSGGPVAWPHLLTLGRSPTLGPADAGNLRDNPIVEACLAWIGTSWPLAELRVERQRGGVWEPMETRHPVLDLLEQPSQDYTGMWLMWALQADYWIRGNAYAQIVLVGTRPVEICYLPASRVTPVADSQGYLSGYRYEVAGQVYELPRGEVIHLRYGIDPERPLLGRSPLASAYREIIADNAASEYQAGLLRGGGIPPWILSPHVPKDGLGASRITVEEAQTLTTQIREWMEHEPGKGRFLPGAVDLHQLAWEPGKMGMEIVHEIPETRICALFQLPPMVLQLRSGLIRSTYSNVREAVQMAWRGCLAPTQDHVAAELTRTLLARYPGGEGLRLRYDRSHVGELQPDIQAQRAVARADYQAGLITREEARAEGGRSTPPEILAELEAQDVAAALPAPVEIRTARARWETRDDDSQGSAASELEQALAQHRAALLEHETRTVQALSRSYRAVEEALEERLERLQARMAEAAAAGESVSPAWAQQEARYLELLDAVEREVTAWGDDAAVTIEAGQGASVQTAVDAGETLARAALGPPPVGATVNWNRLPVETLEAFAGYAGDGSPLATLLQEYAGAAANEVRDALFAALALGESPAAAARRIRRAADLPRQQALRLARTEMLRAAREASREGYRANQTVVQGWVWHAQRDGETCPCCWAMHGTEHDLSERLDDHPNGRCAMAPRTVSWGALLGDDTIPDTRPEIPLGATAFAALPVAEQLAVLGPTLHELYAAGRIVLEDCVTRVTDARWGSMRRAASVAEALQHAEARRR